VTEVSVEAARGAQADSPAAGRATARKRRFTPGVVRVGRGLQRLGLKAAIEIKKAWRVADPTIRRSVEQGPG
jgi:hypothetical protein